MHYYNCQATISQLGVESIGDKGSESRTLLPLVSPGGGEKEREGVWMDGERNLGKGCNYCQPNQYQ